MRQLSHHIFLLSAAFVALGSVPVRGGSSPSNHPVYLGLEAATPAIGNFDVVGSSLVSAQHPRTIAQLFIGTADKVHIVDKTENNPIHDHPAWAAGTQSHIAIMTEHPHCPEFSISQSLARPMDAITNSFCAVREVSLFCRWQFV